MTNDSDGPGWRDATPDRSDSDESGGMTESDWQSIPTDPDDEADLGYRLSEWEQVETRETADYLVFLPDDGVEPKDRAFVVADEESVIDLDTRR